MAKIAKQDPIVAAVWKADDERRAAEFDRIQKSMCKQVDEEAGTLRLWPFDYQVTLVADTNLGEKRDTSTINAGTPWEARMFAERNLRGRLARSHTIRSIRFIELQPL